METATLWKAWRVRREAAAFETLVRAEVPYALDLARRMGASTADAEDIVQEAMLQLAREKSNDPVRVGMRAWICRRVVLRTKMAWRASSRRRRHERALAPHAPSEPVPLEIQDEVQVALRHLGEDERRAVVMRYLHDLDYREIAYVLGVSENACRLRVHKALKRLRSLLGGKAPALVAAIALPVASVDAATIAAVAAKKGATAVGIGLTAKATAATVLAGAVTTTVVMWPEEEPLPPEPPPLVAQVEPEEVPPEPEPEPERKPEPVVVTRGPTGLDVLDRHLEGHDAVMWDWDRVREPVLAAKGEVFRVTTTEFDPRRLPEDAAVVEFGPGEFTLRRPFTRAALVVRGAGMDQTVLKGSSLSSGATDLVLRDFTYDGDLALRGDVAAIFERVRFRNWITTAGFGSPIGVKERAYLGFKECEFLGGYRRPAGGEAINVRGAALVFFDTCRFIDLEHVTLGIHRGTHRRSRVNLLRCELVNTRLYRDGTIFPVVQRSCSSRVVVRCTIGRLKAVLDSYRTRPREHVTGVQVLTWPGLEHSFYAVHVMDTQEQRRVVVIHDGREIENPGLVLPRLPARETVYKTRPLVRVLEANWHKLDPEEAAYGIVEWNLNGPDNQPIPTVCVQTRFERALVQIVSATGETQR